MGLFIRETPDGRRAPGYAVYLAAAAVVCIALGVLHRRVTGGEAGGGRAAGRRERGKASNVASITQAAAVMAPVELTGNETEAKSFRKLDAGQQGPSSPRTPSSSRGTIPGDAAYSPSRDYAAANSGPARSAAQNSDQTQGQSAFNAIDEALAEGDEDKPKEEKGDGFAALPPAFGRDENVNLNSAAAHERSSGLMSYRDATADETTPSSSDSHSNSHSNSSPVPLLPRGTLICVFLLTTVDTGNPAAVLQFAAGRPVYFDHHCRIPFGTRFLGKLSGSAVRDRLNLSADTILYPDGLEMPVSASAVEADDSGANVWPGVAAVYFPPPPWVRAAPYFSDVLTGTLGLLESRAQQQYSIGLGGLSVQAGGGGSDLRAPLYQASAQAMQDFTAAQLKELERRYASHYLIPAGTACWLELEADAKVR